VNGKACAEKYEDIYQARILMIFMIQDKYYECSFLKKVVSTKTEKVHVLEDNC